MIDKHLINSEGEGKNYSVDRFPDECPYCHRAIEPKYLSGFCHTTKHYIHMSFMCTRHDCKNHFIGYYEKWATSPFTFKKVLLGELRNKIFSDIITSISNDFETIYNQALHAEFYNLDNICGVGYRKALEFLIKDFLIFRDVSLKDTVENKLLGKCISEHISNENIKNIAKRAVWLGNDETHYVRKWENKTIEDLKLLIDLTVHWIETEELTRKMIEQMPD